MRRLPILLILLLILVLVCFAPKARAQNRGARLMPHYETRYYTIYTDVTGDDLREAALRMTKMAEEYHARTASFAGSITQKLPFFLYTKLQDYYDAGGMEGSAGMYDASNSRLMAYFDMRADVQPWHVIQHEGFHQFVHAAIGGELPIWVNEGLAEYFGEAVFTGDGYVSGVIPPDRLDRIKQEFAPKEIPKDPGEKAKYFRPVREMMLLAHRDWNDELTIVNYDQAWSMVQFLAHGEQGRYQNAFVNFMRLIGRGQPWERAWQLSFGSAEGFEDKWQAYWKSLPADPTLSLYAKAATATATSLLARATAEKQKFSSFDEFLAAVQNGSLKGDPQDWLPPSLTKEFVDDVSELKKRDAKFELTSPVAGRVATIVCTLKEGTKLTGHFQLNGLRVAQVVVDMPTH